MGRAHAGILPAFASRGLGCTRAARSSGRCFAALAPALWIRGPRAPQTPRGKRREVRARRSWRALRAWWPGWPSRGCVGHARLLRDPPGVTAPARVFGMLACSGRARMFVVRDVRVFGMLARPDARAARTHREPGSLYGRVEEEAGVPDSTATRPFRPSRPRCARRPASARFTAFPCGGWGARGPRIHRDGASAAKHRPEDLAALGHPSPRKANAGKMPACARPS